MKKVKTNNLNEVPKTNNLWIDIGDDIIFKVYYDTEEDNWKEGIFEKNSPFKIIHNCDEEMSEADYLKKTIVCFKCLGFTKPFSEEFTFTYRTIVFGKDKEWGSYITIQTGEEDKDGNYSVRMVQIKDEKWIELAEYFEHCAILFMNDENFNRRIAEDE